MKNNRKKLVVGASIVLFLALISVLCVLLGKPMLEFLSEPDAMRQWVAAQGVLAPLCFVGLMVLQIILAFIPGEPLEVAAGVAFGAVNGTLLCMLGATIGGLLVFLFVRRWGMRAIEVFFSREKIQSIKWLQDERKLDFMLITLFLIPGTPKDIMTYAVGLTTMKLPKWMAITTFARVPSIVTSTISGDALGVGQYQLAAIVYGATLLVSIAGLIVYRKVSQSSSS